ncbi:MAG: ribonuclease HII [Gammaproteobacteria bacterium]|nr:ribonuclease HII [Gammaproteobacteria bacterium]
MIIVGVDEAGRGPLAGPVTAAAVILSVSRPIAGLNDSKVLSLKKREYLYELIYDQAEAVSVAQASVLEIDNINILQASLLAMQKAVANLNIAGNLVLVDGNVCPALEIECFAIVKGDSLVAEISAASIIAKVTRDREMQEMHEIYPEYGFNKHSGYGTAQHLHALEKYGPCNIHRTTFAPVRNKIISLNLK